MSGITEKAFVYKFWGGVGLFLFGAILAITLQLTGYWEKLSPVGYGALQFVIPVWCMFTGSIMLVGMTLVKLYNALRGKRVQ